MGFDILVDFGCDFGDFKIDFVVDFNDFSMIWVVILVVILVIR